MPPVRRAVLRDAATPSALAAACSLLVLAWLAYCSRTYSSRGGATVGLPRTLRHVPGALVFISIGDMGTGSPLQRAVAAQLAAAVEAYNASFILGLGDNIYENGITDVHDPQLTAKHLDMYREPSVRGIPWYMALGDHDSCGNVTAQTELGEQLPWWRMPAQYYSFRQRIPQGGEVNFVVTDSVPLEAAVADGAKRRFEGIYDDAVSGADAGHRELQWLEDTLAGSTAEWTIVSGHRPVYSGAARDAWPAEKRFQGAMRPLLAEHRVDLYINGHDHTVQHVIGDGGVNYIVNGIGGYGRHEVNAIPGKTQMKSSEYNGFAVHQVTRSAMTVTWVDTEGRLRDQITVHPRRERGDGVLAKREPKSGRDRREVDAQMDADVRIDM